MADRLIDPERLKKIIRRHIQEHPGNPTYEKVMELVCGILDDCPTVDAVELPYHPRPMLKDRNPHNTDVYCPGCGTNLSGYYGDKPLPILTCFNCGEILDPYKAVTKTDRKREADAEE